jgi:hypothetical protein
LGKSIHLIGVDRGAGGPPETQADAVQAFTTLGDVKERLQTLDPGDTVSLQL